MDNCGGKDSLTFLGMRLESQLVLRRHVIIETNKTTARIFPEVPDCETPEFWDHMEKLIVLNKCASAFLHQSLCSAGSECSCSATHCRWQALALHSAGPSQCNGSACSGSRGEAVSILSQDLLSPTALSSTCRGCNWCVITELQRMPAGSWLPLASQTLLQS